MASKKEQIIHELQEVRSILLIDNSLDMVYMMFERLIDKVIDIYAPAKK